VGRELAFAKYPEHGVRIPDIDGKQRGHRPEW
jgi:hypothetical protein